MRLALPEDAISRGRTLWEERSDRERLLLGVLAILAAVAIVLFVVVRPLQAARAKAIADIRTFETLNAGMRAAGPNLGRSAAFSGSLPTIVTSSAASEGLTIQRLDPEGAQTRVLIDNGSYDSLIAWLAELQRSGVKITELKLDRRPTPGMVSAQVLLGQ